jgi:uncharacterized membrane protein
LGTFADLASLSSGVNKMTGGNMPEYAGLLLLLGTLLALPAMATGFVELAKLKGNDLVQKIAARHMNCIFLSWSFYLASLFFRYKIDSDDNQVGLSLVSSLIGFFFLSVAGWYGGKMVYGHGVGVNK